jgi:hypothetical protein
LESGLELLDLVALLGPRDRMDQGVKTAKTGPPVCQALRGNKDRRDHKDQLALKEAQALLDLLAL